MTHILDTSFGNGTIVSIGSASVSASLAARDPALHMGEADGCPRRRWSRAKPSTSRATSPGPSRLTAPCCSGPDQPARLVLARRCLPGDRPGRGGDLVVSRGDPAPARARADLEPAGSRPRPAGTRPPRPKRATGASSSSSPVIPRPANLEAPPGASRCREPCRRGACASKPVAGGLTLCQQRRFGEAEARFHDALTLKPDSADVLNDLGTVLGLQSRPEEAVGTTSRGRSRRSRTHARAHANLAAALFGLNRLDEAEAAAQARPGAQARLPLRAQQSGDDPPRDRPPERCRAIVSRGPAAGAGSSRGPEQPGRCTRRSGAGTGSPGVRSIGRWP